MKKIDQTPFEPEFLDEKEIRNFYSQACKQIELAMLQAHINCKLHPDKEEYRQQYVNFARELHIITGDLELTLKSLNNV
jgi:hypothetical protein